MTKQTAEQYALVAAGTVIVALTAGGFWLSYAHLAEVAGQHGLKSSPVRQWAWPATLDAFIVAGELLMLRAGLRRLTDGWAIALTATGSVGSIALNVAGVSGAGGPGAKPLLDYVVAAVPPTAALLAFGVLMRQIHQLVDQPIGRMGPALDEGPEAATNAAGRATEPPAGSSARVAGTSAPGIGQQATWGPPSWGHGRGTRGDRSDRRCRAGQSHPGHCPKGHTGQGTDGQRGTADRGDGSPSTRARSRFRHRSR